MSAADGWSIQLSMGEHDGQTYAEARLIMKDDDHLVGRGAAHRNPADMNVTEIGEEIALARALTDLGHRLLNAAATEIEAITHERARLHS